MALLRSFGFAIAGLAQLLRTQRNFRIEVVVGAVALASGIWARLERWAVTREPTMQLYLASPGEAAPGKPVEIVAPFADTHWGTREMAVRDPDGRTLKLESQGT